MLRTVMFFSWSLYFYLAGVACFLLALTGAGIRQSVWWPVTAVTTFIGFTLLLQFFLLKNNRGLLLLENYAPLVSKNRWLYPVTAVLFFAAGFGFFIIGAATISK